MEFQENILGLIGNTPLVRLNRLARDVKAQVFAKMENLNPGYSVKDRIGMAMIEAAEREGTLETRRHRDRGNIRKHRNRFGASRRLSKVTNAFL